MSAWIRKLQWELDKFKWRVPFFRLDRKLIAIQVINGRQRLTFSEIDRVVFSLWLKSECDYMPKETLKLLFDSRASQLTERDRDIKLKMMISRARMILFLSGILVQTCEDDQMSAYTGWEKDEFEKLIEQAEHPSLSSQVSASQSLANHPRLNEFLRNAIENNRDDLVSRALAILSRWN